MVVRLTDCLYAGLCLKLAGLVQRSTDSGATQYSSRETSELSQWLCHDDSIINIFVLIIIITRQPPAYSYV